MPRKMMEGRLFIGRRKGRPHLRWMEKMKDRELWRMVVEEAKAHPGL
jgi:hypothetical protein